MREIVIVIRDLYLQRELTGDPPAARASRKVIPPVRPAGAGTSPEASAPGLAHLVRFGHKSALTEGWRPWAARWLDLPQYAAAVPASVAAAALENAPADRAVWLATPVHLIAGLTSLHFDRRSLLRLPGAELQALAAGFRDTFNGSGFDLQPLEGGELLLCAPGVSGPVRTIEPARLPLTAMAEALPVGEGAPALRRLGAEIEMWLHGHPINAARERRGALTVGTLWLWGGGAPAASPPGALPEILERAYGFDAYLRGLWRLAGGEVRPMPVDWAAMLGEPRARRALGVVEVAELLHANPSWNLEDAVAQIDRRLISPSLAALHRGGLERFVLLANDRSFTVRAADRWRLWRRKRAGFEGLL